MQKQLGTFHKHELYIHTREKTRAIQIKIIGCHKYGMPAECLEWKEGFDF